ncbi:T9SS type A sorting domain-containing protein [Hymenobacter sp. ISL-91]|uniref:beta strand repeat-containing protein n=1 Tax=Hymenobacter sp. ISL-91 TaxID=2819151 RepID=UPI001BE76F26|nr:T9SS type A sorting domain-containing protein [Hymenobacter sp. ISL-91]MBT2559357.1 T9SS type A sorting domain-containing protein [Hymenobacter sp. ISL-91]
MKKTLLSSKTAMPRQLLAGWRPALLLTLGLLPVLPAAAQQRPLLKPVDVATRLTLPVLAAAPVAAAPAAPRTARRGPLAAIASTATGGNWSDPTSWVGGVVPTATDDVTIVDGATVTLDVAATVASLTVAGGSLLSSAATGYSLAVAGSVTNNGTLDLSATPAIGSDLRFTGAGNATFGGTGTTDLQTITLAKAARADVVEMNLPTLSVKGSTTSGDGFLLTRTTGATPADDMTGTLKLSGTATISSKVFGNAASYSIPATGGFWLNNPNFTVVAQNGTATVNGLARLSAGSYNVGTAAGNSLFLGSGSALTVEGGTLTAAGRVTSFTSATAAAATTFTLSGGSINVSNVGNTSGAPSFGINGTTTISGGSINLVQRSTATTPLDYYVAGTYNFSGGTLNVGTAATATNFDFRIRGGAPNLVLDNTTSPKSALLQGQTNVFGTALITAGSNLNLNGQLLLQLGPGITNNGTLTGTTTNSTLYFGGSTPQTLGGSGTFTTLRTLSLDNIGGGLTLNAPLTTLRVNMFTGDLNGAGNLTVGDGTPAIFAIQTGVTGNTGTSGSLTSAPVFNVGNGALQLVYAAETANRTTGFEVPATRIVDIITVLNPAGVTLAGGQLTVNTSGVSNGTLTLANGVFTTSAANPLVLGTGAPTFPTGSGASYVNGPLGIIVNSATPVSRTFAVGDATGWRPVVVTGITAATDQLFTATVVKAATGGTLSGGLSNLNATRYVRLENSVALPATARVQLSYGADDELGDPATAIVAQSATAGGSYANLGGATVATPTTGIISTQDLTPGNDFFVLANTEGGTLATSVATVCAGTNTGTLTLSGTTGTVTGYEANSGSGFVAVAGTNTGATYTFSNLTATTTFRAVLTTADGRTVYSAPVTVVVTPATTATFSYATASFCQSGTNPTPTITGTAGGTFSSTAGLSLDAATGAINLSASTAGTYVVTYTVAGTCGSSATFSVTITTPATAGFSYATASFCTSATGTVTPTLASGATAGTFSSTTGLTIDAATGAITPATSTPGTYVITNSVAASGACAAVTATFSVTITAPATAGFSYASANYCVGATNPSPVLATGASAGTFSSTAGLVISATGVINLSTSTPGVYVVTNSVAASGACAAVTATFSVTINARPAQPTVSVQYSGPVTTLTSSAATGNQWLLNGAAIAGATNPTYVVNSAAQLGSYTVTTTNAAGCTSLPSAPLVITTSNQPLAGSSLQLYPNPTTDGRLTVKLGGYTKAVELTVYNAVGQLVRTLTVPAGRLEQLLDLSQLPSGVYALKARTEGGLDVRRIVKE